MTLEPLGAWCELCSQPAGHPAGGHPAIGHPAPPASTVAVPCGRPECIARARALAASALTRAAMQADMARQMAIRETARVKRRAVVEKALPERAALLCADAGLDPEDVTVLPIPYFETELERVPYRRRRALEKHIGSILERLARTTQCADPVEAQGDISASEPMSSPSPCDLSSLACRSCQGKCCSAGGNHAFLDEPLLRRLGARLTRRQIVDAYRARVPARSCRDSCLFHGERGCALPRDLRSHTCNQHLCPELRAALGHHRRDPGRPLVLGAIADGNLHGVAHFPRMDDGTPGLGKA